MKISFGIMKSNIVIGCIIFLLCNIIAVANALQEALIFDRSDDSLFLFPNIIPLENLKPKRGDWVTACPAETGPEKDFIENQSSLKKNGLFIKKIYEKGSEILEEKNTRICERSYELSLAYKVQNSTFQFGYEIYYKHSEKDQFDLHYNPLDYQSPSEVIKSMKTTFKKGIYEAKQYIRIFGNTLRIGLKNLRLGGEKMEFLWLYQFKLSFDLNKKILEETWHEIQANSRWNVPETCEDYSLGAELYEDINLDELYNNQIEMLEKFEPITPFCKINTEPCLKKWPLIPLDQFNFGSVIPAQCSNIVTIPIWAGRVKNILKKLDKYLYTLFLVLNEPIHVHSGIIGEHKFLNTKDGRAAPIYLDSENNRISVPKIIYKIIEYRLKNCKLEESSCWYSAVIVITNDPDFLNTRDDKVCSEDKAIDWGWEEIIKDSQGNYSNLIYVCQNSENVQKKLSMDKGSREKVAGGLDLSRFTYSEDGGRTRPEKDIKTPVDLMFKKLSEEKNHADIENYVIVERVQFQNDVFDVSKITDDASEEAVKKIRK